MLLSGSRRKRRRRRTCSRRRRRREREKKKKKTKKGRSGEEVIAAEVEFGGKSSTESSRAADETPADLAQVPICRSHAERVNPRRNSADVSASHDCVAARQNWSHPETLRCSPLSSREKGKERCRRADDARQEEDAACAVPTDPPDTNSFPVSLHEPSDLSMNLNNSVDSHRCDETAAHQMCNSKVSVNTADCRATRARRTDVFHSPSSPSSSSSSSSTVTVLSDISTQSVLYNNSRKEKKKKKKKKIERERENYLLLHNILADTRPPLL
ncbi:hypothetical protein F2P81_007422 [Scophthalmus maximus]|uniref:Uncharacterized protein n=1 Tax=Scophthalmus maximus TaxID=52904 RepID=A0A6A4TE86_SCOMX|nr:hypothetical protein F2P81_007422 [Scophthalmus maximus]